MVSKQFVKSTLDEYRREKHNHLLSCTSWEESVRTQSHVYAIVQIYNRLFGEEMPVSPSALDYTT